MTQAPILTPDPLTDHVYVITEYRYVHGALVAEAQTDVTEAFRATVRWMSETGRLTALLAQ